jgi:hypothetical protein
MKVLILLLLIRAGSSWACELETTCISCIKQGCMFYVDFEGKEAALVVKSSLLCVHFENAGKTLMAVTSSIIM